VSSGNYLDICYHNIRDLRPKSVEMFNSGCIFDFKVIWLTGTCLNECFPGTKCFLHIVLIETMTLNCVVKKPELLYLKQFLALNVDVT
jgi:hypothetical protein